MKYIKNTAKTWMHMDKSNIYFSNGYKNCGKNARWNVNKTILKVFTEVILKSRTLSRTSDTTETRNTCVIKIILLACFTYIDIFLFIKSLLTY
jgi:hypothetical protein